MRFQSSLIAVLVAAHLLLPSASAAEAQTHSETDQKTSAGPSEALWHFDTHG